MTYPKRVFLIDDDDDDRDIFSLGLKEIDQSIELIWERDSEVALQNLSKDREALPDLLFVDWNMPKITGKECLQTLRKVKRLAGIPIIVYTTSTRPEDKTEAERLGASYFFTKSPTIRELARKLRQVFLKFSFIDKP